jgi:hypothetical protein
LICRGGGRRGSSARIADLPAIVSNQLKAFA